MKEWPIARVDEITEPGAYEFRVGEGDWPFRGFVVRWEGRVYAFGNTCPHAGHPLNFRPDQFFTPDMNLLVCSSHGAQFEPATGICVAGPCQGAQLMSLQCRVIDGQVRVEAPESMRQENTD